MAEQKVTTMVLNVDLQSSKCYKKVKNLLCKYSEIRDQEYDEKANKVTIKVVCCSPERIRDKLCCKGGGCIKSIEIKEPEKKSNKENSKEQEKEKEEQKEPAEETKKKKEDSPKPKDGPGKQPLTIELDLKLPLPPPVPRPLGFCCDDCYSGRPGGPCWSGGRAQYDGCYGRPVYDSWGWGGCTSSYAYYCTEQYQEGCTIM
ncbi:hypothetical protein SLE2022_323120 [Rubroshorea leprosula]